MENVDVTEASADALAGDELTKVSVLMTSGAHDAMARAAVATGDTLTDTMNRAMHVYAHVVTAEPGTTISFDLAAPGGRRRRLIVDA